MNTDKIKEVLSDKAFVETLRSLQSPEEVQEALKEKGVDFREEECLGIYEFIKKLNEGKFSEQDLATIKSMAMASREDGELSEDDLENVAGGMAWWKWAVGIAAGKGVGIVVCAIIEICD